MIDALYIGREQLMPNPPAEARSRSRKKREREGERGERAGSLAYLALYARESRGKLIRFSTYTE